MSKYILNAVLEHTGVGKIIFSLPDFFNPVKNDTGDQNQDKQAVTVVALSLASIERNTLNERKQNRER